MNFNQKPTRVSKTFRFNNIKANYGNGVAVRHYKEFVSFGIRSAYESEGENSELFNELAEWKYILFVCHMIDDEYNQSTS